MGTDHQENCEMCGQPAGHRIGGSEYAGDSVIELFVNGGLQAMENVSMLRSINLEISEQMIMRAGIKSWTHYIIDRMVELHQPLVIKHEQLVEQHKVLQAEYEKLGGEVFKGE